MVALTERMVERAANGDLTDGDTLRLLSFLADRMGYQRGITVEHTQAKPWEVTMEHIITELPDEYEPVSHTPYRPPAIEDIEDAEVVEEPDTGRGEFDGVRIGPINGGRAGVIRGSAEPIRRDRRDEY